MTILLNNVNANITSDPFKFGKGGPAVIFIRADDFGRGTITISTAPPGDTAIRFEELFNGATKQQTEIRIDYLPSGTHVRVRLSRATNPVNVFVEIV